MQSQLTTVKNLARESDGVFSEGAIRNMLVKHKAALADCVIKVGHRTLIDKQGFYAALPTLGKKAA
ncbi:MAG: hypothetical protein H6975_05215 [Gammaproteobacteria bacterium]|nr:hypothetical protein [Gammaproteobacteria bacterium]